MSPLAKLRALHEEACRAWRKQSYPSISEGEAGVLAAGMVLLERMVAVSCLHEEGSDKGLICAAKELEAYIRLVYAQFDDDADILITGSR